MAGQPRGRISRDQVVDAALELLAGGVEACSVRAVAGRLGVTPMAIYWHVADKDALLEAVLDRVLDAIEAPTPGLADDSFAVIAALARSYRAAFARHPNAVALLAARPAPRGDRGRALMDGLVQLLGAAGLSDPDDLGCAAMLLLEFVMGAVLLEHGVRPGAELPLALPDADTRFEFGLTCLLDGLRARVA